MFGINGGELLVLLVVAVVVVGPERLPRYAEQLAVWVRTARRYALSAKERVTEELGDDVRDVDWAALDPRRYDPRRIVREALLEDLSPAPGRPGPDGRHRAAAPVARGATAAAPGAAAGHPTASGRTGVGSVRSGGAAASAVPPRTAVPAPFDDEAT